MANRNTGKCAARLLSANFAQKCLQIYEKRRTVLALCAAPYLILENNDDFALLRMLVFFCWRAVSCRGQVCQKKGALLIHVLFIQLLQVTNLILEKVI